ARRRAAPTDGLDAGGGQALGPAAAQRLCGPAAPGDCRTDVYLGGGLRRLSKDYGYQVESSEALIYAGMSQLILRRMTRRLARSSLDGWMTFKTVIMSTALTRRQENGVGYPEREPCRGRQ